MTVAELRAKLNEFPDDALVFTWDSERGPSEVGEPYLCKMYEEILPGMAIKSAWDSIPPHDSSRLLRTVQGVCL